MLYDCQENNYGSHFFFNQKWNFAWLKTVINQPLPLQPRGDFFGEQDFEIAGSRAGELSISLESPLGTCTSWDSHVHYRQRIGNTPLPWGVALHCDASHLTSPTGIVRILLVVGSLKGARHSSWGWCTFFFVCFFQISSAACLACECSAGTVQVGLFLLPLIGRLRLMVSFNWFFCPSMCSLFYRCFISFQVFCALFSLLITCLMLFLDISHIALMFPFNWGKLVSIVGWFPCQSIRVMMIHIVVCSLFYFILFCRMHGCTWQSVYYFLLARHCWYTWCFLLRNLCGCQSTPRTHCSYQR